jgi:hypothetical protein
MTTPEQAADRARVDQFIAEWMAEQVVKFDQAAVRRAEQTARIKARVGESETWREESEKWVNDYDFAEHMRLRFPVGVFLDRIKVDDTGEDKPTTKQLMQTFETGRMLINAALSHPDATEDFIEDAEGLWGSAVVGAMLDELKDGMGYDDMIPRRDPVTNKWNYQ